MSAVPQRILSWLHGALKNEYHNVNRTYSDVAQTVSHNPTLHLRTDVYTHENGDSRLLLNVLGTLPVAFRGITYAFPISIWIPREYPSAAPLGFVAPTENMAVRPGQYVSGEGRIYHPYLAGWREDRSSLSELCSILQNIFAQEPPVVARQAPVPRAQQSRGQDPTPPPIPPLPPEARGLGQDPRRVQSPSTQQPSPPPPPPPKPFQIQNRPTQQIGQPPTLPPHPGELQPQIQSRDRGQHVYDRGPQPVYSQPPLPNIYANVDARSSSVYNGRQPPHQQLYDEPVSPLDPEPQIQSQAGYSSKMAETVQWPGYQQVSALQPNGTTIDGYHERYANNEKHHSTAFRSSRQQPPQSPYQQNYSQSQIQQQKPRPPKPPPEDLLTSPFENTLAVQPSEIAPPPIPPNPQKDALLSALSQTITQQTHSSHNSNLSALPPLRAQQKALTSTLDAITAEMSQLNDLDALLSSNEAIIHKAMRDADKVLEDAKRRDVPNVDEVLVAPTIVTGQLYQLVAEERSIAESRVVLGKALDKGRIGSSVWAKQTRGLARDEFLKKALIKKISRGMGLVEQGGW